MNRTLDWSTVLPYLHDATILDWVVPNTRETTDLEIKVLCTPDAGLTEVEDRTLLLQFRRVRSLVMQLHPWTTCDHGDSIDEVIKVDSASTVDPLDPFLAQLNVTAWSIRCSSGSRCDVTCLECTVTAIEESGDN